MGALQSTHALSLSRDLKSLYRVDEVISCGTYSSVLRCVDKTTSSACALKILDRRALLEWATLRRESARLVRGQGNEPQVGDEEEDEADVSFLVQELAAMQHHQHPHLAQFHVLQTPGSANTVTLASDLCAQSDLLGLLCGRDGAPLPEPVVASLGAQIASALQFLHAHNTAHGDVRPEHILLHISSPVQVSDKGVDSGGPLDLSLISLSTAAVLVQWSVLGAWSRLDASSPSERSQALLSLLSPPAHSDKNKDKEKDRDRRSPGQKRPIGNGDSESSNCGGIFSQAPSQPPSPWFLSPEQFEGQVYAPPSDMWSLGMVLYLCLTGHVPFEDAGYLDRLSKLVRSTSAPFPDEWWHRVSPEARAAVIGLLRPQPHLRTTAHDLLRCDWFKRYVDPEVLQNLQQTRPTSSEHKSFASKPATLATSHVTATDSGGNTHAGGFRMPIPRGSAASTCLSSAPIAALPDVAGTGSTLFKSTQVDAKVQPQAATAVDEKYGEERDGASGIMDGKPLGLAGYSQSVLQDGEAMDALVAHLIETNEGLEPEHLAAYSQHHH